MKKTIITVTAALLTLSGQAAPKSKAGGIRVVDLRTERMLSPMSVDTPAPRLGWRITANENGVMQK